MTPRAVVLSRTEVPVTDTDPDIASTQQNPEAGVTPPDARGSTRSQ
ncbi:hypothetical protein [Microbacterium sp. GXS0129]